MAKPLVSIIILSALRRGCTQSCLESIKLFTQGIDYEIIVVDMGMDPAIRGWLINFSSGRNNFKLVFNSGNVGTSKGRNQGIALSEGAYVVFLDNDTLVSDGWLKGLLGAAGRHRKAGLFGAKLICPNEYVYFCNRYVYDLPVAGVRRIGVRVVEPFKNNASAANVEERVAWYPTGCLMAKRELIGALNGFDENLCFVEEDKDLCLRAAGLGAEVVYCPSSLVIHDRVHDDAYERLIRYANLARIQEDIEYFESKWECKVDLIYSRACLKHLGYSELMIERMRLGELKKFFQVV